jgi:hypothetical protein
MIPAVGVLADIPDAQRDDFMRHHQAGSVPLLDTHDSSLILGWVDALFPAARDLWFTAAVDDLLAHRLRRGPVELSLEAEGRDVAPSGTSTPGRYERTAFSGERGRAGWTLLAVACLLDGQAPARPGSALWLA